MRTFLILTLLLSSTNNVHITDKRVKCFFENFYELVDISADARIKANAYLKTFDFSQQRTLNDISKIEFFDEIDFKTPEKLSKILLNVNQMSDQLRRIVENCFPLSNELKRRCEEAFPKDGCEVFDGFVAARNCQKGFFGVDWVYCVPHCPSNYDEDPDDPFVCKKTEKSNFSYELAEHHGIVKQNENLDAFKPKMNPGLTMSETPITKSQNLVLKFISQVTHGSEKDNKSITEKKDNPQNDTKIEKPQANKDSKINASAKTLDSKRSSENVKTSKNTKEKTNDEQKTQKIRKLATNSMTKKKKKRAKKDSGKDLLNFFIMIFGKPATRKESILNRFLPCPEGYLKIGADICVRTCPFGWSDFGASCAKPLVKRRDFELFFYSLDIDGKENVELEKEKRVE